MSEGIRHPFGSRDPSKRRVIPSGGSARRIPPSRTGDPIAQARPSPLAALFPHQRRALEALEGWLAAERRPLGVLCLPTGAGKTLTAASFVVGHMLARGPVLWLAHRTELIDQAIGTLEQLGGSAARPFTVGRWHRERTYGPVDVVVASIPTLTLGYRHGGRNLSRLLHAHPRFSLVVVDECHHGVALTWTWLIEELRKRLPQTRILGLSATPTRHAEQEQPLLWELFKEVIHEEPVLDLIDSGILARPTVIPVDTQVTFDATASEELALRAGGDIPSSLLERIATSEARNVAVVDTYSERGDAWGQTLVFAATVKQARWIASTLRERGTQVVEAYASTPAEKRADAIEAFRLKRARVLVNVGLFTEGTDLPGVESLFLARPTRSRVLFQQMVGRGMRGPRIGGAECVAVVAFHESILGLLQDRLASSFSSEHDALLALGFPGERLPAGGTAAAPTPDPTMDRLVKVARQLLAASETAKSGAALPLRGFWEARIKGDTVYLPVFGHELALTSSWVNYLRSPRRDPRAALGLPEGLRAPATVITPFVAVATRLAARVRWIDLERAEREDMLAAAEAWDRASPKTPSQPQSPSPKPAARADHEVEQFVASMTASPEESPRRETPPPTGGPPAPTGTTLLEALRTQPRSEWRALVREEGRRVGPRDDVEVLLGLLENVLRSD